MERCSFRGNRYIAGVNASVTMFENTQTTVSWSDVVNCTFAYNTVDTTGF